MKNIVILIIFTFQFYNSYSQFKNRFVDSNYVEERIHVVEMHIGSSIGSPKSVNTGFIDNNQNPINMVTNGGYLVGGSIGYFTDKFADVIIGYDYQQSSLTYKYSNGNGFFKRYVLYPMAFIHPIRLNRYSFGLGFGVNCILNSNMDINFNLKSISQHVHYDFKSSYGPLLLTNFQIFIAKWISSSIIIKYNINSIDLSTFKINEAYQSNLSAPAEIQSFNSNCVFYCINLQLYFN